MKKKWKQKKERIKEWIKGKEEFNLIVLSRKTQCRKYPQRVTQ